jgi:hypothetical protein
MAGKWVYPYRPCLGSFTAGSSRGTAAGPGTLEVNSSSGVSVAGTTTRGTYGTTGGAGTTYGVSQFEPGQLAAADVCVDE